MEDDISPMDWSNEMLKEVHVFFCHCNRIPFDGRVYFIDDSLCRMVDLTGGLFENASNYPITKSSKKNGVGARKTRDIGIVFLMFNPQKFGCKCSNL
mmetsp:Transcript_32449/g.55295  ORF Transcript_32449/g.55295 Transcript_32449/m.55295 type:complete len:97 (-) Transcript_32449:209-499(-)